MAVAPIQRFVEPQCPAYWPARGSQSSILLPSGSITQPNLPKSEVSVLSITLQPSVRNAARSASRSATRKLIIKDAELGSIFFVSWANGLQMVIPGGLSGPPHSNMAMPQSVTSKPRWSRYQTPRLLGSADLKKIPPMPVTLFISVSYSWVRVKRRVFRGLTAELTRDGASSFKHRRTV